MAQPSIIGYAGMMSSMPFELSELGMKRGNSYDFSKAGARKQRESAESHACVSGRVAVAFQHIKAAFQSDTWSSSTKRSHASPEVTLTKVPDSQQPEPSGETHQVDSNADNGMDTMEARIFSNIEETGGLERWLKESLAEPWLTNDNTRGVSSSTQPVPENFPAYPVYQDDFGQVSAQNHEHDSSQVRTPSEFDTQALPLEWNGLSGSIAASNLNSSYEYSCEEYLALSDATTQHWSLLSDSSTSFPEDIVWGESPEPICGQPAIDGEGHGRQELCILKQVTGRHLFFTTFNQLDKINDLLYRPVFS